MKRLKLLLAGAALLLTQLSATAQLMSTADFEYRYGDYSNECYRIIIFADVEDNDFANAEFAMGCRSGQKFLPATVSVRGEAALRRLHAELRAIRNKYAEWLATARTNGITKLEKELPVKTSRVTITYFDMDINELASMELGLKALFRAEHHSLSLLPDTDNITICGYTAPAKDAPILHVNSTADLDRIIRALDIVNIRASVAKQRQESSLFR